MITNRADLDRAINWMRKVGYQQDQTASTWPMRVSCGWLDIVCAGESCPWKIAANPPSYPQPHNFLADAIVAPWVVEEIMGISRSVHEQKENR